MAVGISPPPKSEDSKADFFPGEVLAARAGLAASTLSTRSATSAAEEIFIVRVCIAPSFCVVRVSTSVLAFS